MLLVCAEVSLRTQVRSTRRCRASKQVEVDDGILASILAFWCIRVVFESSMPQNWSMKEDRDWIWHVPWLPSVMSTEQHYHVREHGSLFYSILELIWWYGPQNLVMKWNLREGGPLKLCIWSWGWLSPWFQAKPKSFLTIFKPPFHHKSIGETGHNIACLSTPVFNWHSTKLAVQFN